MKYKKWDIAVLGVKRSTRTHNSNFYTTDTNAWLKFRLTDSGFNPDKATVTLMNDDDDSVVSEAVSVNDKEVEFHMRPEIIEHGGDWHVQLVFEYDGKDYTSSVIRFRVDGHILDEEQPKLESIENINTFLKQAKELFAANESERWSKHEQNENAWSERARSNEENRTNTFNKNESERQQTFVDNERERQTIVKLTVEQYNQLEDKSERSLYVIVDE